MKIFDMHIHASSVKADREKLLSQMDAGGVFGGCVFSNQPYLPKEGTIFESGTSFDVRLNEILELTKGYEDRLFPVMWIHPDEPDIMSNIHKAADSGILAFKMICNDFYVYEEKCMKLLRECAKLKKPVIFHSGILWDKGVSSKYNRPLNWEALLEIEGLKFSMGHCSWPWIDECVALYGKFLNSLTHRNTAEMFFDITPGTPKIYRKELLQKIYNVGYDVGDNVMFGTDASAENYNSEWAADWIKTDREILLELGVSSENLNKLYYNNLLRFLGKSGEKISHESPVSDSEQAWSPVNPKTSEVIKYWYQRLGFSKGYDDEFEKALDEIKISDAIDIKNYNKKSTDGRRNLLSYLYMCDALKKRYEEAGICEEILVDTLVDLVRWADTWSDLKGELYLGELDWLSHHLEFKLFKIGRLQFCMAESEFDIPEKDISKGDNVIEIHIPKDGPLDILECEKSIESAKEFFEKYFPEFEYNYFTCHSWLLDESLGDILDENSNIIKFQKLFKIVDNEKSDSILGYIFRWGVNRAGIKNLCPASKFAENVRNRVLKNDDFYIGLGVIDKEYKND